MVFFHSYGTVYQRVLLNSSPGMTLLRPPIFQELPPVRKHFTEKCCPLASCLLLHVHPSNLVNWEICRNLYQREQPGGFGGVWKLGTPKSMDCYRMSSALFDPKPTWRLLQHLKATLRSPTAGNDLLQPWGISQVTSVQLSWSNDYLGLPPWLGDPPGSLGALKSKTSLGGWPLIKKPSSASAWHKLLTLWWPAKS